MEKGYKVFNPDWTCRDFQYEVGKTYEMDEKPSLCNHGFHYCQKLVDCFGYYAFNPNNKVAEVEAVGDIDGGNDGDKHCTNKIKIVRELSWFEVLKMVNVGSGNTGYRNSGNYNSGYYNSGNCNSGNYNSGKYNSGYCNSGNCNSGNSNSGYCNSGYYNSGKYNSGKYNSGYYNSGNYNSGYYNSGNRNSGYMNSGNYHSGAFNTEENPTIKLFDKDSDMTWDDFYCSDACSILDTCPQTYSDFISESLMSEEEKEAHPEYKTTGGFVKKFACTNEDRQKWWDELSEDKKETVKSLPNFDSEIFCKCVDIYHV